MLILPPHQERKDEGGLRKQGKFKYSTSKKDLVTIITVVFNGGETIEKTIQSVVHQTYDNQEYIIIDGGSTDNTLDIIRKHDSEIDYWVSEPDCGIYDAMNKGISLVRGKWILFLGADDWLLYEQVVADFMQYSSDSVSLIYGDVIYNNNYKFKSILNCRTLLHNTIHHQSCFYHFSLFENFRYDSSYKLCADYELNLLIFLEKKTSVYANASLSFCALGGCSTTVKNRRTSINEMNSIREKHVRWMTNALMFFGINLLYLKDLLKRKFLTKIKVLHKMIIFKVRYKLFK